MGITEIKPEQWKIYKECPNCHREIEVTNTPRKVGTGYQFQINIPTFCVYCEEEKRKKEEQEK